MTFNLLNDEYILPVDRETTETSLRVTGEIPKYLNGRYVRCGPNALPGQYDPGQYSIFGFTGDGMVHGVCLRDGRAEWYRNRWVRSPLVSRALGEKAIKPNNRAGHSLLAPNTTVFGHAGKTIAGAEAGIAPYELTYDLDTVGTCDFGGTLQRGFTGHPKHDPVTGEMHAISYQLMGPRSPRYLVVGTDGAVRKDTPLDVPNNPLLHDMALTENYMLFFDTPLEFDPVGLVRGLSPQWAPQLVQRAAAALVNRFEPPSFVTSLMSRMPRPISSELPLKWNSNHPTRIGVVPRKGPSVVRWFEIEPCYVFHTLNAHEENGFIVCDAVRMDAAIADGQYYVRDAQALGRPKMHRWQLDLEAGVVKESRTDDRLQEFPMVDPRYVSLPHRYGFATSLGYSDDSPLHNGEDALGILRYDFTNDTTVEHRLDPGHLPGEFSPVPASDDADEAAGVLIGFEYDRTTDLSNLLILDMQSMEKVATVHLPVRVPFQFHGNWIPNT